MTEVTIVPLKHPVLIRVAKQSDYENNKTRIKRIIKTKYKLNKFVYATGEWYNENDKDKSVVVKRFTDEKGYTNALLFKGSQQLLNDVKALLDFLKIKYEEKEVSEEAPKQQVPTPPAISKVPITEITPEEILKMHKESEDRAFTDYATGRITAYNAEIEKKVRFGMLDEEQACKMKEEFLKNSSSDWFVFINLLSVEATALPSRSSADISKNTGISLFTLSRLRARLLVSLPSISCMKLDEAISLICSILKFTTVEMCVFFASASALRSSNTVFSRAAFSAE